jgi:hypothetical protein
MTGSPERPGLPVFVDTPMCALSVELAEGQNFYRGQYARAQIFW